MKFSRSKPGFPLSFAIHAGLLLAAVFLFAEVKKFEETQEMIPVEVMTESNLNALTQGEKTAPETKPGPRIDKVAPETHTQPLPPLAEAKKDAPTPPPPQLRPTPDQGADDKPEPTPPKRVAALPPAPEKKQEKPAVAKPVPTPPAKPKAAVEEEKDEPEDAEVVKPKPPTRPKLEKQVKETPEETPEETPKPPEKPKTPPRLRANELAKLLESKKQLEKLAAQEDAEGDPADKSAKGAKPKSSDAVAPKSRFDAASILNLLSREAPQRTASTGAETRLASLGAPEGTAGKLSATMESRIAAYIHDHYHPCWASALTLGRVTYAPVVEFHLSRDGELEGRPKLLNASANPTEKARGEQAVQAVRRCSPMKIPPDFLPYYEQALREVTIRFQDSN